MIVVLLVAASRDLPRHAVSWLSQKVSCPAEIFSDEQVFHRWGVLLVLEFL